MGQKALKHLAAIEVIIICISEPILLKDLPLLFLFILLLR